LSNAKTFSAKRMRWVAEEGVSGIEEKLALVSGDARPEDDDRD